MLLADFVSFELDFKKSPVAIRASKPYKKVRKTCIACY
jgi:hypothetical protein